MFAVTPFRSTRAVALALTLAAALACAQAPDTLPNAPQPQPQIELPQQFALANANQPLPPQAQGGIGRKAGDMSPVGQLPNDAPIVAMAPHPDNQSWWLSGQANIIIQGDLPFHSPYQGENSFIGRGEYKTSMVGTLYTALRPTHSIRYNTDLILDLESSGGRGLSEAIALS